MAEVLVLVDHAGGVPARDGGQLEGHRVRQGPVAEQPVDRVDARRPDPDADRPRTRVRFGCVLHGEDLGTAVAVEARCAHGLLLVVATPAASNPDRARMFPGTMTL